MTTTHLERTKDVVRISEVLTGATITKISNISPTIKLLKVHIEDPSLTFKPGQWVDFHIPTISVVCGYSMCSTPGLLKEKNELHLAVKYSDHKPTDWVHNECKDGSKVQVKVGGDIFYDLADRKNNNKENLILIAGGVGINPLFSMFQNNYEILRNYPNKNNGFGMTTMLYSATSENELVFKDEINSIISHDERFNASYFVTKSCNESFQDETLVNNRRIDKSDVERVVEKIVLNGEYDHNSIIVHLCGPVPMMNDMKNILLKLNIQNENIKYESWW